MDIPLYPCITLTNVLIYFHGFVNAGIAMNVQYRVVPGYWVQHDTLEVNGWVLRSRLEFARAHGGDERLQRVLEALDEKERSIWTSVDINAWYDVRQIEPFERELARQLGLDEETAYIRMGEVSAERAFHPERGHYRRFLGQPPEVFLKLAAKWQNEYYNTGLTEYYPTGVTACMIRTRYIPYTTRSNCLSNLGFFRRSIEILGGQKVKAEERRCVAHGDEWCEFHFSWQSE